MWGSRFYIGDLLSLGLGYILDTETEQVTEFVMMATYSEFLNTTQDHSPYITLNPNPIL